MATKIQLDELLSCLDALQVSLKDCTGFRGIIGHRSSIRQSGHDGCDYIMDLTPTFFLIHKTISSQLAIVFRDEINESIDPIIAKLQHFLA